MGAPCKQVIWENNNEGTIDSVLVGVGSLDEQDLQVVIRKSIVEMLTNEKRDWSAFGKSGDCIKIV